MNMMLYFIIMKIRSKSESCLFDHKESLDILQSNFSKIAYKNDKKFAKKRKLTKGTSAVHSEIRAKAQKVNEIKEILMQNI